MAITRRRERRRSRIASFAGIELSVWGEGVWSDEKEPRKKRKKEDGRFRQGVGYDMGCKGMVAIELSGRIEMEIENTQKKEEKENRRGIHEYIRGY